MISAGTKNTTTHWSVALGQTSSDNCSQQHRPRTRHSRGLRQTVLMTPTGAVAPAALPCAILHATSLPHFMGQVKKQVADVKKSLLPVLQNKVFAHCQFDLLQLFKQKYSGEKKNFTIVAAESNLYYGITQLGKHITRHGCHRPNTLFFFFLLNL